MFSKASMKASDKHDIACMAEVVACVIMVIAPMQLLPKVLVSALVLGAIWLAIRHFDILSKNETDESAEI